MRLNRVLAVTAIAVVASLADPSYSQSAPSFGAGIFHVQQQSPPRVCLAGQQDLSSSSAEVEFPWGFYEGCLGLPTYECLNCCSTESDQCYAYCQLLPWGERAPCRKSCLNGYYFCEDDCNN